LKAWFRRGVQFCIFAWATANAAACKKQEKPKVRTEPWPAPAVSASGSVRSQATIPYVLERASVEIEFRAKKRRTIGRLARVEGDLTFDPIRLERTRGAVRADLLDLRLYPYGQEEEDASLTLAALRALELTAGRPNEERERGRFAELNIVGFELPAPATGERPRAKAVVKAFVELTLHRFRVPYTVELEVELVHDTPGAPPKLRARTYRPLVVPLVAHDILPRERGGSLSPSPTAALDREFARDARISAELSFLPAAASASPPNP